MTSWVVRIATVPLMWALLPAAILAPDAQAQGRRPGLAGPRAPVRQRQPGRIVEQWNRMTPEQRRRILENLPPERKQQLEQRLEEYNRLTPAERERLRSRLEGFDQLPPERQEAARRLFRRFNLMPEDRRSALREELQSWRGLSEAELRNRMNSDEFRNKYTANEQGLLRDMARLRAEAAPE